MSANILFDEQCSAAVCVCVAYTQVIVDVDVVQPAQVLVRLQEAGELMVLSGRLGQQLPPLPLLHIPAEKEVSKVLQAGSETQFNY